jgi:hypothetical protein
MRRIIDIDLFDALRDGNDQFAQLLDPSQWDVLKSKLDDPTNTKSLETLIKELLDGR